MLDSRRARRPSRLGAVLLAVLLSGGCSTEKTTSGATIDSVTVTLGSTGTSSGTIDVGQTATLSAVVHGTGNFESSVTWETPSGGILTPTGNSATFRSTTTGTFTITARSTADATRAGAATVTVQRFGTRLFGTDQAAAGVALDPAGSIYVLGSYDCDTSCHVYVEKLDPMGTSQWRKVLDSGVREEPAAIAYDPSSAAIVVVGETEGTLPGATPSNAGGYDGFVAKMDSADGHTLWTRLIGTSSLDYADGVAVDAQGSIYVVGYTSGTLGSDAKPGLVDAFLAMLDAGGTVQYTRLYGSTEDDTPRSISLAPPNGLYVVGSTLGSLDGVAAGGTDSFLARFDRSTGAFTWVVQYRSAGLENQQAFDVTADSAGNALVTGFSATGTFEGQTIAAVTDAFVSKVSPQGTKLWTRAVLADAGTSADHLKGFGIARLSDDSVVIAGGDTAYSQSGGRNSGFIARFSPSGERAPWAPRRLMSATNAGLDELAVDTADNIVTVGYTDASIDGVSFTGTAATLVTTFGPGGEHP